MDKERVRSRWLVVLGAVLIQVCLGAIYAWSVFTPSLIDAGWTKLQTQMVFSVGLVTFAVVMVWSGRKLPVWGPRKLVWIGGLVLGLGYLMAGLLGATNLLVVTVSVGFIGGAGIGMGYVVPIAVGMRWFPDKKGMITGLAVAGFGFGAMAWVKLAGAWGNLIASLGLAATFSIYGLAFAGLVLLGGIWMVMPPKDWVPEGYVPPEASGKSNGGEEFTVGRMLETPQFYLIFLTFTISAGAGLMSIGLMKLYPIEALTNAGMSPEAASAVAGTAMAVFFSLANGIGRIAWGMLSDKLGRKRSILIMTATQGVVIIAFTAMAGNPATLFLGAALIGFNFGGNFALFPTITADTFGTKRVGQNYPYIFLSYGVGGILGPFLGGILGDMNDFPLAFSICGVACIFGAGLISMVTQPKGEALTGLTPSDSKEVTVETQAGLSFRELRPTDAQGICAFPQNERELFHMFPAANHPLESRQLLEVALEREDPTVILLEDQLAGYANFFSCQTGGVCALGNMVVDPELRRKGVGAYLVKVMAEKAKTNHNALTLRATVYNDNTSALLFYADQGFVPAGLEQRKGMDGTTAVAIHMDKKLAA